MIWPFVSDRTTLSDILSQMVKSTAELHAMTLQLQQQVRILTIIANREVQPAKDLAQIRRLLWRLVVQPTEFKVLTRGESMGFMNKTLALGPVTEDVVKQVVTIAAPSKVAITKELGVAEGQTVDFSVPAGTEVTISLQYFDEADNPSPTVSRTFVVVDDVAPEGPAALADIVSVSETDAPLFATLGDVVVPAPVDPAPVDPVPVDPAPVDPAPVDPAPVDPAPPVE